MRESDLVIISLLLILMAFHFCTKRQQVRSHTCCWETSSHVVILIKPQKPVKITQWDQMNKTSLYSSAVEKTKNTTPQNTKDNCRVQMGALENHTKVAEAAAQKWERKNGEIRNSQKKTSLRGMDGLLNQRSWWVKMRSRLAAPPWKSLCSSCQ